MKRALFAAVALVPAGVLAQPIGEGGPGPTGDSPISLDPGTRPSSGTPAPGPAAAPKPNVYVVGPDGRVTSTEPAPAESGYYVSGGQAGYPQPNEIHAGAVPDLHVVRTGDTLWDISFYYFNDPWQWPKVWSYNPQITNPHWIYPGDLVRLLPRGMFSTPDGPIGDPIRTPDALPAPARRIEVSVRQTAFVERADLDRSITIVGSVDEKQLLGDGDSVYLSYPKDKPPQVGQRYSIYVQGRKVKNHGAYVRVIGTVEVVSVKEDKRARGVIINATQEIERGAKVGPLVKVFKAVPPVLPKVDAQAAIVAILTRDQLIGTGEVVFVALGKSSGVVAGNRMYVVRRGDAYPEEMSSQVGKDDRAFPARALGEIMIVEVGEDISIGLVTLSVQEMSIGDMVMMQKAP